MFNLYFIWQKTTAGRPWMNASPKRSGGKYINPSLRVPRVGGRGFLFVCLSIALNNLRRNKFRSFLTLLGIIMGIASVVSIYTIGIGFNNVIKKEFEALGINTVIIMPFKLEFGRGHGRNRGFERIALKDIQAVKDEYGDKISLIVPKLFAYGRKVSYKNKFFNSNIVGATPEFFIIGDKQLRLGNYFGYLDLNKAGKVCILGDGVTEETFGKENPVGKTVKIGHVPFEVIGVLMKYPRGRMYFGNLDTEVIVPYTTMQRTLLGKGEDFVMEARAVVYKNVDVLEIKDKITGLLRQRKKVLPDEEEKFTVTTAEQFSDILGKMVGEFISFLSVAAFISLLIGGIGIMNIMLVSVSERTKEIGIRMAVGATAKDIVFQFLIEAVVLSFLGGIMGVLLAAPGSIAIAKFLGWPTKISPAVVFIAFIFSSGIGVVFGYYPARCAAALDPIEALRYE